MISTSLQAEDFVHRPDKITSQFQIEISERQSNGTLAAAPGSLKPRAVSKLGLALIMHFEGKVLDGNGIHVPYNDAAHFCTIGYGHLIKKKDCASFDLGEFEDGISEERAKEVLVDDLLHARFAVQKHTKFEEDKGGGPIGLSLAEYSSLVSFVFNVGEGNFSRSTLLRRLRQDLRDHAAREFLRWVRAGGQILPGLIVRRECEQTLFRGKLVVRS